MSCRGKDQDADRLRELWSVATCAGTVLGSVTEETRTSCPQSQVHVLAFNSLTLPDPPTLKRCYAVRSMLCLHSD